MAADVASDLLRSHDRGAHYTVMTGLACAFFGSAAGLLIGSWAGVIRPPESWLIGACAAFSVVMLGVLAKRRIEESKWVAEVASGFFAAYLLAGGTLVLAETTDLSRLLPYLLWFFPLIAFNKFANFGRSRKLLGTLIAAGPALLLAGHWRTLIDGFAPSDAGALMIFALCYTAFAVYLNLFALYREAYLREAEGARAVQFAAQAVRETERRYQRLFDSTGAGMGQLDADGRIQSCNVAFRSMVGSDRNVEGVPFDACLHPEAAAEWRGRMAEMAAGRIGSFSLAGRLATGDAPERHVECSCDRVAAAGALPEAIVFACQDVTERHAVEMRLRQAQRLEAVGRLTGGIAHDFNNLLTVVMGSAELLSRELQDRPSLRRAAEVTLTAAERGAELTRRLLAFARRQPLAPKPADLNRLLGRMRELLARTLPEDVAVDLHEAPDLWTVEIDETQLEASILNLAINARDAMNGGGSLTIETANVRLDKAVGAGNPEIEPGAYATISLTDTGHGMTPEIAARAFEPFFSTKRDDGGTGLGLSMVYGFVRQSGGHVKIYSEPGVGTSVRLLFPRVEATAPECEASAAEGPPPAGSERVLVVEDDPQVRAQVVQALGTLGYAVREAEGGEDALALLRRDAAVDLLLTDVVMPGMNGPDLADAARRLRPDLRVLFTSGYAEHALVRNGRLPADVLLLTKPYRRQDLATMIRRALDPAGPTST